MRLLLINANTTEAVTDLCASAARLVAAPSTVITPVTAAYGAKIIESRAENAIAAHAMLDLLAEHRGQADAALIAVSYDTGLLAARDIAGFPVLGITQASLVTAGLLGSRIGLVTFGTPWLYRELAESYGLGARLAGIEVISGSARDAYSDPASVTATVAATARLLVERDAADVVVLCGAAISGFAAVIEADFAVPVLDGVTCGVKLCEMLVGLNKTSARAPAGPGAIGISSTLNELLYRR